MIALTVGQQDIVDITFGESPTAERYWIRRGIGEGSGLVIVIADPPALSAQEWRPIEMVPKDGQYALIVGKGLYADRARVGRYDESSKRFIWTDCDKVWIDATHWMPLPEPPR